MARATQLSAREGSCAVRDDATLWCWGHLRDIKREVSAIPVEAKLPEGVAEVSRGDGPICARTNDGSVWCWKDSQPARVVELGTSVAQIAAGRTHACARKTDGTVWCWGSNEFGQLGDGTKVDRAAPARVTGAGSDIAGVAVGDDCTCVRKTDSSLWCWGRNGYQKLGHPTEAVLTTPWRVTSFAAEVAQVSLGKYHLCVRKTDGTVWCRGDNTHGQVGDGTTVLRRYEPVQVLALRDVVEISAGDLHTCAITRGGGVFCWGHNGSGQLGDGTAVNRESPVPVLGLCR